MRNKEIFVNTCKIIENLVEDEDEVIPERRRRSEGSTVERYLYHSYLMRDELESAEQSLIKEIGNILDRVSEVLKLRFSCFLDNCIFKDIATFLNTKAYMYTEVDELLEAVNKVFDYFSFIFQENGCKEEELKKELKILHMHVSTFFKSTSMCWPTIFQLKDTLNINNILHVAELCIAIPLSNAECERVFSFLWRLYMKERQSLHHETLERLLILRCDDDYDAGNYSHAIELFLNEYPDGAIRKRSRLADGYVSSRKMTKTSSSTIHDGVISVDTTDSIPLDDISEDEWSDSE